MSLPTTARRLLLGWTLILVVFAGLGYIRWQLREVYLQNKAWIGALGNVTSCRSVRRGYGGYVHDFQYRSRSGQQITQQANLDRSHPLGESLAIEYLESEPDLYRELGRPARWSDVMGLGWLVALTLACCTTLMGYFGWTLRQRTVGPR